MNRSINLKAFAAAIFVSFAGYPAATAQNTGTGGPLKQAELPQPVALNVLWRVVVNGVDRMTSVGPEERNAFPSEGQMFYIAADLQEPGTTLERLAFTTRSCAFSRSLTASSFTTPLRTRS